MRATLTRYVMPGVIDSAGMKLPKSISKYVIDAAATGRHVSFGRYPSNGQDEREIESAVLGRGGALGWYGKNRWLVSRSYVSDRIVVAGDVCGIRIDVSKGLDVAFFAWLHPLFEDFLMGGGYVGFSEPYVGSRGNIWPFTLYPVLKPFQPADFNAFCSEMDRKLQKLA